ncbi:MAG TPA: dienelactone hydrolase family protein [Streptosporangiaceae bacterium]|jgi:predicted esterase|nr:dienelactone hydrolase family protein [Streptosporangiaceae bacterium]
MSGDELARPRTGTAMGVPYVALPPTAADADPDGVPPLIVAWPGRRPPRTETALAAAVPLTGIPGWRVYVGLPDGTAEGEVVERAASDTPALLAEVRTDLGLTDGPIGLAGFSLGATVALRVLVRREVAASAAALIAPLPLAGHGAADLAPDVAGAVAAGDPALLLAGGGNDDAVPPSELAALRDRLRTAGVSDVEMAVFRMGHALAAEPGTDARPQIAEAISVDAALTDWFRAHLGVRPRGLSDPAPATMRGATV